MEKVGLKKNNIKLLFFVSNNLILYSLYGIYNRIICSFGLSSSFVTRVLKFLLSA